MQIYQISVFLENRAGQLAEITGILADNGIDMRAINIAETADYGILRIITVNSQRTIDILKEHGFIANRTPVLAVGVPDRPGGLAELVKVLADHQVDVEYMYSVFGQPNGMAYMIFRVNELEKVRSILEENKIVVADGADLGIC